MAASQFLSRGAHVLVSSAARARGQPRKRWRSVNTTLRSDRARKTISKDNPTMQDLLNFFSEVDAVRRSTGGGSVQSSLPPTMENFDMLTTVTVDYVK